jgi:hypothetical protein
VLHALVGGVDQPRGWRLRVCCVCHACHVSLLHRPLQVDIPVSPFSKKPTPERPPTFSYNSTEVGPGWVDLHEGKQGPPYNPYVQHHTKVWYPTLVPGDPDSQAPTILMLCGSLACGYWALCIAGCWVGCGGRYGGALD